MSDRESSLRDLKLMQERMNALLEESVRGGGSPADDLGAPVWIPAADVFETDSEVVLLVDVPGVARGHVKVSVDRGTLVVRGERRVPEWLDTVEKRVECAYGAFSRSFDLPPTIDDTRIRAEHRDGIVMVRLPRQETPRARQFEIEVE